jgi:hypothetical protein
MVSMKNIRKRLAAIVLSVSAIFGGLALAGIADAGTYTTATTCAHATAGNRICFDISAGTVTVYNNSNAVIAGPTSASLTGASPSRGWIAYDYECNAGVSGDTSFSTPGGYGLPTSLRFVDGNFPPLAGNINVSTSAMNTIAWYANSNQGYECFIVV